MFSLLSFIGVIALFLQLSSLKDRISRLEKKGLPSTEPVTSDIKESVVKNDEAQKKESGTVKEKADEQSAGDAFIEWLKVDWMLKVGAGILLIGVGWFVTYAFMQNWIGPMGRITLGYLFGVSFLVYGWHRLSDTHFARRAAVFLIVGSTTILATTFAARAVYDFFTPITSLGIMFATSAFVAISGVRFVPSLGVAGVVMAGVAPYLTHSTTIDTLLLFAYLLVVILGAQIVVLISGRREVVFAGLIMVALHSSPYLVSSSYSPLAQHQPLVLTFIYIFAMVFFVSSLLGLMRLSQLGIKETTKELPTALGNGLLLLVWILIVANKDLQSLILSLWTVVFVTGAFLLYRRTNMPQLFYSYALVGLVFLGSATAVELNGYALIIAYTLEAGIIAFAMYGLLNNVAFYRNAAALFSIPIILSFRVFESYYNGYAYPYGVVPQVIFSKENAVLFLLALVLGLLAAYTRAIMKYVQEKVEELSAVFKFYIITSSAYAYYLIWKVAHILWPGSVGTFFALTLYTIIGLATFIQGTHNDIKALRLYGSVLIAIVVGRLLLVDVWDMEMGLRIITFFVIGALLMTTAFISRKSQN